ncbi:hypothetical protein ABER23_09840 [Paenibacillus lautus]
MKTMKTIKRMNETGRSSPGKKLMTGKMQTSAFFGAPRKGQVL